MPTKAARHAENARSWRIDCTGSSKGKASGSKHDKLVLEFSSDKDCHEFQAALSLCKVGPQKVIDDRNAASARAAARKAEDDKKAAADAAAMSEMLRLKKIEDEEGFTLPGHSTPDSSPSASPSVVNLNSTEIVDGARDHNEALRVTNSFVQLISLLSFDRVQDRSLQLLEELSQSVQNAMLCAPPTPSSPAHVPATV